MPDQAKLQHENWLYNTWRPAMGWMYFVVCIADFIIFPILWGYLQAHDGGQITIQWDPLTLKGAGLFHMAMGAIIGITAWGRSQEKIHHISNGHHSYDHEYNPARARYEEDDPVTRRAARRSSV